YMEFKTIHYLFYFFFSSRRRHTRLQGDWSSDVCSSDLDGIVVDDEHSTTGPPERSHTEGGQACKNHTQPGVSRNTESRLAFAVRSEERRVGKECRSRRGPSQ